MVLLFAQRVGFIGTAACVLTWSIPATATVSAGPVTITSSAACLHTWAVPVTADVRESLAGLTSCLVTWSVPSTAAVVPSAVTIAPSPAPAATWTIPATAGIAIDPYSRLITFNGGDRTLNIDQASLEIHDVLNETPNTASFTVTGAVPTSGMVVVIYQGSISNRIFAGVITEIQQIYKGVKANVSYHVTCQDFTWLLNRRLVTKRWTNVSASTIATEIVTGFTSGFTTSAVVAGLATVTEFQCEREEVTTALTRLARVINGAWYPDYNYDVHFFLTETTDTPDEINSTTISTRTGYSGARDVVYSTDLSQVRTRVQVLGASARIDADVPVGSVSLPIDDGSVLNTAGGSMVAGANLITYAAVGGTSGLGSVVNGPPSTPSTPSAFFSAESGGVLGNVRYVITNVIDNDATDQRGETNISAPSTIVAGTTVATPAGGVAVAQFDAAATRSVTVTRSGSEATLAWSSGAPGNLVAAPGCAILITGTTSGVYDGVFRVARVDSAGRPVVSGVSPLGPVLAGGTAVLIADGDLVGAYTYKCTLESSLGETLSSSAFSITGALASIAVPSHTFTPTTGGSMAEGYYLYYFCGVSQSGRETALTVQGGTEQYISPGLGTSAMAITFSATISDQRIRSIRLYRVTRASTGAYDVPRLVRTFEVVASGSYSFTDTTATASLGGFATATGVGEAFALTGLATTTDTRARSLNIYRTKAGGSVYYHAARVAVGTTQHLDTKSDDELGELLSVATVSEFGGSAITVAVAAGPTGTVSRNIYRLKSGEYLFCGSLGDNTTLTYTDKKKDDDLGRIAPEFSRLRTLPGSIELYVSDCASFVASQQAWADVGSQKIRYTTKSATTGPGYLLVPATGLGAITAPISADAEIVNQPYVNGIPASGTGSVVYAINKGEQARITVTRNDTAAQTALAALEGGDGIREHVLDDSSLTSIAAMEQAGDADLATFKSVQTKLSFVSRDTKLRSGKTISVNLGAPNNLSGAFLIQQVDIFDFTPRQYPLRRVQAAKQWVTFEDFLRRTRTTR